MSLDVFKRLEGVKYFGGKGLSFMKNNDQTICVLGGRNLDEFNGCGFDSNPYHPAKKAYMAEFNITSNVWSITNDRYNYDLES